MINKILHNLRKCFKQRESIKESSNTNVASNTKSYSESFEPVKEKEIKIFDIKVSEHNNRLLIQGKFASQSIYFYSAPHFVASVGKSKVEVLVLPTQNIFVESNAKDFVEPLEEGEFCHYLVENTAKLIDPSDLNPIEVTSFDAIKSRHRP